MSSHPTVAEPGARSERGPTAVESIGPTYHLPETGGASYSTGRRYEWRIEDGLRVLYVSPLTPDDALHPREDDELAASKFHSESLVELHNLINRCYRRGDRSRVLLMDVNVDLGLAGIKPIRPDLVVFVGVENPRHLTQSVATIRIAEESERLRVPLVVEVTSEETRSNDLSQEKKLGFYDRVGIIEQYIVIDTEGSEEGAPIKLLDYHRARGRLALRAPDDQGRIRVECLNARMELIEVDGETRIRMLDAETGAVIAGLLELEALAEAERARAEQADARAEQEKARADQEKARAEQEKARAEQEREQAVAERARALALEAELRELRRRLESPGAST